MPFFCADPDGEACRALIAQLERVRSRVDVAMDGDAFADYDVSGSLGGVRVPVLAIAGAQDRATTPADTGAIAVRAGDGHLVTIDGAGHFPYAEQPAAYVAAVREFLVL